MTTEQRIEQIKERIAFRRDALCYGDRVRGDSDISRHAIDDLQFLIHRINCLEKDKARLDWMEKNAVVIGISGMAYIEIDATRDAIDSEQSANRPANQTEGE
jgi:hypothetical protein